MTAPDTANKYPSEELTAWTNEWLGSPEAQKKTMLMFFIEKACDWQRERDALICDEAAAKHRRAPTANDYYSCDDARGEACEELADAIRHPQAPNATEGGK